MEHVDTSNRVGFYKETPMQVVFDDEMFQKDFNYAVVSRGLTKAEDKNAFMENLQQKNFIVKKEKPIDIVSEQ